MQTILISQPTQIVIAIIIVVAAVVIMEILITKI